MNINGAGTTGTVVAGNKIGTNLAGTAALPNNGFGIAILQATATTIGGTTPAARNVISGNTNAGGVSISGTGRPATSSPATSWEPPRPAPRPCPTRPAW